MIKMSASLTLAPAVLVSGQSTEFPRSAWRQVYAAALGWSAENLQEARRYSGELGSTAVVVVHRGVIVDQWGDTTRPINVRSIRKSLLNALLGMAVDEGRLDLRRTLGELGIDDREPSLSDAEKKATVADLLTSRSGVYHDAAYVVPGSASDRPAPEYPRFVGGRVDSEAEAGDFKGTHLAVDAFVSTFGFTDDVGMQGEHILATYLESAITERDLFPAPYMYVPFWLQFYLDYKPGDGPFKVSAAEQARILLKSKLLPARRALGMMSKIRDEMTGEVLLDGSIDKRTTARDKAKLAEARELHVRLLEQAGAEPQSIFNGPVESGHPCCTAGIGRVVDKNQETEIPGMYLADASVFPSPLGLPPILTIVAMSKRLSRHLLGSS